MFPGNMTESHENLYTKNNSIRSSNITHPVDKFGSSICDRNSGHSYINLTRHVYISYDKGNVKICNEFVRLNIIIFSKVNLKGILLLHMLSFLFLNGCSVLLTECSFC